MGGFKSLYHTGGVLAGAIWQQNGFLSELGRQFPALTYITDYYSNYGHGGYNGWSSPWPVAPRRWEAVISSDLRETIHMMLAVETSTEMARTGTVAGPG